ncbi:hypothetical protein EJ02DRAFT_189291 [Clathrospora elynae]|uniref:Uncharacterized protein n=1 Tax=Clathrospora elynae TaxID=706981 RepID=A0A6A5SMB4_9PLEO|nr:hypothetical protein EJ02DRAFT_189291 [Clathrospora elynae]
MIASALSNSASPYSGPWKKFRTRTLVRFISISDQPKHATRVDLSREKCLTWPWDNQHHVHGLACTARTRKFAVTRHHEVAKQPVLDPPKLLHLLSSEWVSSNCATHRALDSSPKQLPAHRHRHRPGGCKSAGKRLASAVLRWYLRERPSTSRATVRSVT